MASPAPLPPLCLPERFAESWINAPSHVVMGVRLRAFCLWHRMLFETFGLPWGRPTGKGETPVVPTVLHLAAAVQICRTEYGEQPDFAPLADFCAPRRSLWRKLRARRRLPRGFDREMVAFARYLTDFAAPPELWEKQGKGRGPSEKAPADSRPPGTLAVVTRLVGHGFDERRAWEMPEGMAHWYSATALWLAGEEVPFVTEKDETLDFIKKLQERAKRRKAAKKAREKKENA